MDSPLARYAEGRRKGWQARLANAVGVSEASVSRYVSGDRLPDLSIAIKIERATKRAVRLTDWPHLQPVLTSLRRQRAA